MNLCVTVLAAVAFWQARTVWSLERCILQHPVDFGRSVDSDSLYLQTPFTPGNLTEFTTDGYTYRINDFCSDEHISNHINAPYQYNENGWAADEIPLDRLIANAVFMNFSKQVAGNDSFILEPEYIVNWVRIHGPVPNNAILVISFGWAELYSNKTQYLGTDTGEFADIRQPAISIATARMLIDMNIVGIVMDTLSLDKTGQVVIRATLAAQNIYNVEQTALEEHCLPPRGFRLFVMPMKMRGTGAPVRIIAVPSHEYYKF